ncbi:lipopolysaccharide biosynthesis protein [Methylocella sp.]|uniref:lipopolysaccharide biosynthesis protein n=1 Tax=Methylocella sp. TaxID=1978226 RepID=UPI0037842C1B
MPSLGRKLVSGAIWTAAASWGSQIIAFGVFVALARFLTPQQFGLATLAMIPPFFLSVFVTTGIVDALVQRRDVERGHLVSAFWLVCAMGLALSGAIFAGAELLAAFFGQPELRELLRWSCLVVAIESFAVVPTALLRRDLAFRTLALRGFFATATSAIVGVGMAAHGFGVWSLIAYQLARTGAGTALVFAGSRFLPSFSYSRARIAELLPFARPIVAQSLLAFVNGELPAFVLGAFLGPAAVGVYSFARRPFQVLWEVCLTPLLGLVMPTVARIRDDPGKTDRFFNAALRMTALCAFPVFIGFAAVAPVAVPVVFGPQWSGAVVVVTILTPLAILMIIDALCVYTILALGHSKLVFKLKGAFTIVSAGPIVVAAHVSPEALAATVVLCQLAFLPLMMVSARRIAGVDVRRPLDIFPKLALASLLMFVAARAAELNAPAQAPQLAVLAFAILVGAAVYVAGALGLVRGDLALARDLVLKNRMPS